MKEKTINKKEDMKDYSKFGYVQVSTICPRLFLAKPDKNKDKIMELFKKESSKGSLIVLAPELCLVGYTCEDLFLTKDLLDQSNKALKDLLKETSSIESFLVVGHPYQAYDGRLYNCASIMYKGKLLAMIPKIHLPNYSEFYEKRYFSSGLDVDLVINDFDQTFHLNAKQIVNFNNKALIGIEICEDLWSPIPPSTLLCLQGANIMLNLSASNELVNKHQYRKELISQQSSRLYCAYLYVSSGPFESSKETVFSGSQLHYEVGTNLADGKRFSFEDECVVSTVDLDRISSERRKNTTFGSMKVSEKVHMIHINGEYCLSQLCRNYPSLPFVPNDQKTIVERSEEILQIQSTGLARRMMSIGKPKILLGLSGGLDSTLALLVMLQAVSKVNQSPKDIICISMPGFGTSNRTKSQAENLAKACGITFMEIDIKDSVLAHFKAIGHDPSVHNVVYENAQAKERMSILMSMGNSHGGIVINSTDLSEACTGYSSILGDHAGHYAVNSSVPKTLIKHLIRYYKDYKTNNDDFKNVLQAVLDTKISPELLPLDKDGNISQQTEEVVGPYSLIDFFLYYYLRYTFSQDKILELAVLAFENEFDRSTIEKWHADFFKRFFKNQFKRSMMPVGPKVGVSVSPRSDLRLLEDA